MKKIFLTLTVIIVAMLSSPFASAAFAKSKSGPVDSSPVVCVNPDGPTLCVTVNGKMIMPKNHVCDSTETAV